MSAADRPGVDERPRRDGAGDARFAVLALALVLGFFTVAIAIELWPSGGEEPAAAMSTTTTVLAGAQQTPAIWTLAPGGVDGTAQSFVALVVRAECSGGSTGVVHGPSVQIDSAGIVVAFTVDALPSGVYTCPSNPAVPVVVDLGEPIAGRPLVDGACRTQTPAVVAFCEHDGVRTGLAATELPSFLAQPHDGCDLAPPASLDELGTVHTIVSPDHGDVVTIEVTPSITTFCPGGTVPATLSIRNRSERPLDLSFGRGLILGSNGTAKWNVVNIAPLKIEADETLTLPVSFTVPAVAVGTYNLFVEGYSPITTVNIAVNQPASTG